MAFALHQQPHAVGLADGSPAWGESVFVQRNERQAMEGSQSS